LNSSLVTGLLLNVTTTGVAGQTGTKLYTIDVQVSCLPSTATAPTHCASGTTLATLPVNLNGTAVIIPVAISPSIDPEVTEIDDLSFIVTGSTADLYMRNCFPIYCYTLVTVGIPSPVLMPDFFLFSLSDNGITLHCGSSTTGGSCAISSATVTKIVQSSNGYTGTVTLSASAPPGLTATIGPPISQLVPSGGSVTYTETISTTPTTLLGNYFVLNTATDGTLTHVFGVFVHVVP
jgi:hypothetical protein